MQTKQCYSHPEKAGQKNCGVNYNITYYNIMYRVGQYNGGVNPVYSHNIAYNQKKKIYMKRIPQFFQILIIQKQIFSLFLGIF